MMNFATGNTRDNLMLVIMLINPSRTKSTIYLKKKQRKTRIDKCMCLHRKQREERVCAKQYREKERTRITCP